MNSDEDLPDQWFRDTISAGFAQCHAIESVLYSGKTAFQAVRFLQAREWGRCLILDGKMQSSELDEFIYHEALVHPALVTHPHPRAVFIAGGGEGATLREVLAYRSIERAVMVDLDRELVELCRQFLPGWHQGAFDDPRAELLHLDARKYLAESPDTFDAIIIDVTDPLEGNPSYLLYTQEFYALASKRLASGGILAVQAESSSLREFSLFVAIVNTLSQVFPTVLPYQADVPSFGSTWGFVLASPDTVGTLPPLSATEIDFRLATRVGRGLRFYDGATHQGMFTLPRYLRQEISRGKRVITDSRPMALLS